MEKSADLFQEKLGDATGVTPPMEERGRANKCFQSGLLVGTVLVLGFASGLQPLFPFFLGTNHGLSIFLIILLYSSLQLVK